MWIWTDTLNVLFQFKITHFQTLLFHGHVVFSSVQFSWVLWNVKLFSCVASHPAASDSEWSNGSKGVFVYSLYHGPRELLPSTASVKSPTPAVPRTSRNSVATPTLHPPALADQPARCSCPTPHPRKPRYRWRDVDRLPSIGNKKLSLLTYTSVYLRATTNAWEKGSF